MAAEWADFLYKGTLICLFFMVFAGFNIYIYIYNVELEGFSNVILKKKAI